QKNGYERQPAAARRPLNLGAASEYQDTLPFLLGSWVALLGSLRPAAISRLVGRIHPT
ncbi:MAG: hypothetical protein Q9203_005959, partial [Teloschistes exilis]